MLTALSSLPSSSRAWIYQADRELSPVDEQKISSELSFFCQQWAAHGAPLASNFEIRNHRFVILLVDEGPQAASGCSIDGSVRVIKNLQQQLGVDFFDRTLVPFDVNGRVEIIPLNRLSKAFADGRLTSQSVTYNMLASTKAELDDCWRLPVESSWLAKYLAKSSLVS